jgi:hypothetical protein
MALVLWAILANNLKSNHLFLALLGMFVETRIPVFASFQAEALI